MTTTTARPCRLLAVLVLLLALPGMAPAAENSLRIDQNINLKVDAHFTLKFYIFHQLNRDVSDFDYTEMGTGLQYRTPLPWLSLLLWYQQSFSEDAAGTWGMCKNPSINPTVSFAAGPLTVSEQLRWEYRFTPDWKDWRIKNTLQLGLGTVPLKPYLCWELYWEHHDSDFMLHRFKLGISHTVYKSLTLGAYCRFDLSQATGSWVHYRRCIGLSCTLDF